MINVLSLFDGMSCCQQALERSGIKVDNYFASEIDKYAIQVVAIAHNVFGLGEGYEALACVSGSLRQTRVIGSRDF